MRKLKRFIRMFFCKHSNTKSQGLNGGFIFSFCNKCGYTSWNKSKCQ